MVEPLPVALQIEELDRRLSTAILQGVELPVPEVLPEQGDAWLTLATTVLAVAWRGYGRPAQELRSTSYVLAELSRACKVDLLSSFISHPVSGLLLSLGGAILTLESADGWSPAQIAAWLRTRGY